MSKDHYVADAPLGSRDGDLLRRWPFAERIADTLATRSDPTSLVVGVYGRWGEGKTTVLQFIEQRLKEKHADSVVVVRFNPWLFTNDTDLFLGFFAQVAAAIDRQLESAKGKVGGFLKTYGGIVAGLSGVDLSKVGEELAKSTPEELRERLEKALAKKKIRIVVLVDDIDRLDKNEAQAVFRLLKVAADFRWTAYVLAFDREVVADALSERYARRRDGGDEFLDKIVQVPIPLPPLSRGVLRKLLFDEINRVLDDSKIELDERAAFRFMTEFEMRLLDRVETPRAAKRYANALQFALPMLRGEVDVVDLLLIEAIRVFHPRLHAVVAKHREIVLTGGGRYVEEELVEAFKTDLASASGGGPRATADIRLLEDLFPRVKGIFSNTFHGDDWNAIWAKDKRIASERYFARYFASGIPVGDIADAEVEAILAGAADDADECSRRLTALLRDVDAAELVQKIFDAAGEAEGERALAVAHVLVRVGLLFPNPRGSFADFLGPRGRIALLTAILLGRALAGRASEVAEVLGAAPLPFALHVFRRLRPAESEDKGGENKPNVITDDDWRALGRSMLERVREKAVDEWPFGSGFDEGAYRISLWREFGDTSELAAYIGAQVRADPRRALDIVRVFTRTGHSVTSGERMQDPMQSDGYDKLKRMLDPAVLVPALVDLFGGPSDEASGAGIHVESDAELAHSFLRLHAIASRTDDPGSRDQTSSDP